MIRSSTPAWYIALSVALNGVAVVAAVVWLAWYRPAAYRRGLVTWLFRLAAVLPLHGAVRELWRIPGPGIDPVFSGWWDGLGALVTPALAVGFLATMFAARREGWRSVNPT